MRKRILFSGLSCLVIAALLLASCKPTPTTTTTSTTTGTTSTSTSTTTTNTTAVTTVPTTSTTTATSGEPQYGGKLTIVGSAFDADTFDPMVYTTNVNLFMGYYLETLLIGDLSKGPRGTNEFAFGDLYWIPDKLITTHLAESWEQPDPSTIIFHIRKGVQFQGKPGVMAGREMTAGDAEFSFNRIMKNPGSFGTRLNWIKSATATDKYTLEIKMNNFSSNWLLWMMYVPMTVYPPELVTAGITNWRNATGTGPYLLADYVVGGSYTYQRNPNYWGTTTINGKKYKLPFTDTISLLIIPEVATQMAALRAGKADINEAVGWESVDTLEKSFPLLKGLKFPETGSSVLAMRTDTPPLNNEKVRHALNMAIDRQSFLNLFKGGDGVILSWPYSSAWSADLYTELKDYPAETRAMYEYNVPGAKQLLTEAGFSTGFTLELVTVNSSFTLDLASMVKEYWRAIGVTLDIKAMDTGAYVNSLISVTYKHMWWGNFGNGNPESILHNVGYPGDIFNAARINDADYKAKYDKALLTTDVSQRYAMLRELNQYLVNSSGYLIFPCGYTYRYFWPWVKNYYGEINAGVNTRAPIFSAIWIDQKLKKSTGH